MSRARRQARTGFIVFCILNLIAITYPGITPFNRIRPLVLGLPFVFFWVALWVVLGFIMLLLVDAVESR